MQRVWVILVGVLMAWGASSARAEGTFIVPTRDPLVHTSTDLVPETTSAIPIPPSAWMGLTLLGGIITTTVIRRRMRNQG